MIFNETWLIGLSAILLNGIITGFAVYIGTHVGKKVLENSQKKKEDFEEIKKMITFIKPGKIGMSEILDGTETQKPGLNTPSGINAPIPKGKYKNNYERLKKRWQKKPLKADENAQEDNKLIEDNIKPKEEVE